MPDDSICLGQVITLRNRDMMAQTTLGDVDHDHFLLTTRRALDMKLVEDRTHGGRTDVEACLPVGSKRRVISGIVNRPVFDF